ncbi:NAD-dependent epimerase/dehydratase family protein [bacterium]|nr:NAD-dependent epimerase/dehydratase family protein [bacterium]
MMEAVVTGAAGFIGSHLVDYLLNQGLSVTGFDNLSAGQPDRVLSIGSSARNRFRWIEGDVRDLTAVKAAISGHRYVFHLAAAASVPESIERPDFYHENNVTGTSNVLLAARDAGVKRVVFASSSAVYGDNVAMPNHELLPPRPFSPYAAGKLTGEIYCNLFYRAYGLPTVALRFFNVFGPYQNPNSQYAAAIPKFISACQSGSPICIFGDGEQTRDFVYIENVVRALWLACVCSDELVGQVVNVGCGEAITVNHLAETVRRLTGANCEIVHLPPRAGDIRDSVASIDRLHSLGLRDPVGLDTGLVHTIKAYAAE